MNTAIAWIIAAIVAAIVIFAFCPTLIADIIHLIEAIPAAWTAAGL